MSEQIYIVVIGVGVVGLASARALAMAGLEVIVIERNDAFGMETSSRRDLLFLKVKLCEEGLRMLCEFCIDHHVEYRRRGKLIVATTSEQIPTLRNIEQRASRNGVNDLRLLSRAEALAMEPALQYSQALLSPSTGIVDSYGFMPAPLEEMEARVRCTSSSQSSDSPRLRG